MADLSALDRAIRAARRGHTEAARRLFDGVLEAEPENELALTWRARITDDAGAKSVLLRRALAVNPANDWATGALEGLGGVEAGSVATSRSLDDVGSRAASIENLQCPNCGGQVEIHPGRGSKSVVCTHCGSVLDLTSKQLEILGRVKPQFKPNQDIMPGAEGTFEGEHHIVTGWLRYKGWDDEDSWTWDEWQLVSDSGTARYLSYSREEGFMLQTPIRPTPKVTRRGIELPEGRVGFHEKSPAKISGMAGELTWRPQLEKTLEVAEARGRGGLRYSVETTADEIEVVAGRRLKDVTVWKALGRDDILGAMSKRQLEAEERAARRKERAKKRRRTFAAMSKIFFVAFLGFLAFGILAVPRLQSVVTQTSATYESPAVTLPTDRYERTIALHDSVDLGPIEIGGGAHTATVTITTPTGGSASDATPRGVDVDVAFIGEDRDRVHLVGVPTLSGQRGTEVSATSRPYRLERASRNADDPLRLTLLVAREWTGGGGDVAWTEPVSFPVSVEIRRVWLASPLWFAAAFSFFLTFVFFVFSRTGPR